MSHYREHEIWTTGDGIWNIAFYPTAPRSNYDDEDYDEEWDAEYEYWHFGSVFSGKFDSARAIFEANCRTHGNLGSMNHDEHDAETIAKFEKMKAECKFKHPQTIHRRSIWN